MTFQMKMKESKPVDVFQTSNARGLYPSVLYNLMMLIDCRIGIIKYPQCTNQQDNSSFILTSSSQHQAPQSSCDHYTVFPPAPGGCPASKWDKSRLFQTVTQLLFKISGKQLTIGICPQSSTYNLCLPQLPVLERCSH